MLEIVIIKPINWTKCWKFGGSLPKVSIYYQSLYNSSNYYFSLLPNGESLSPVPDSTDFVTMHSRLPSLTPRTGQTPLTGAQQVHLIFK